MLRVTADLVVLTMCWTLPQLVSANNFSKSTMDFLNIFNGNFTDADQYEHGFIKHAYIQFRVIPVTIALFYPAITWYDEWAADGEVLHMHIGVITEKPRDSIEIELFNFTADPSLYKPGEFDVSTLANLKRESLRSNNCTVNFKRLTTGVYVGYWSECRHTIKGHHPNYCLTAACDNTSIILPPTVRETFSIDPYIFQRIGQRYTYAGVPDTYSSICG